jgi:hypothetical protein
MYRPTPQTGRLRADVQDFKFYASASAISEKGQEYPKPWNKRPKNMASWPGKNDEHGVDPPTQPKQWDSFFQAGCLHSMQRAALASPPPHHGWM